MEASVFKLIVKHMIELESEQNGFTFCADKLSTRMNGQTVKQLLALYCESNF